MTAVTAATRVWSMRASLWRSRVLMGNTDVLENMSRMSAYPFARSVTTILTVPMVLMKDLSATLTTAVAPKLVAATAVCRPHRDPCALVPLGKS